MAIVYLSLGSNLGDRVGYLQQATSLLSAMPEINIIQISTTFSPEELLRECQRIENQLGRKREANSGYTDRTIDIDILFYENKIINTDTLTIPHRFFHRRAFLMVPMLEIAEDFVHPLFNKTVENLYDELENPEMVTLYGTRV